MTEPSPTTETIERELAALGEAPPSAEELALLALDDDGLAALDDVATVARLAELGEPLEFDDLSQLETHRGWRTVEQRLAGVDSRDEASDDANANTGEQPARPIGGGPRRWLFAAIGVAAAAAILLIVVRPPTGDQTLAGTEVDAKAVAELGEQARASLKLLDNGTSDTQRATKLAAEYQARLEQEGG